MEEVVRAFNYVIDKGWAFYWATSEWSAREIEEAHRALLAYYKLNEYIYTSNIDVASVLALIAPIAEQCAHKCVSPRSNAIAGSCH